MATAALTLAVGMGVNAVAFSVVNALLFKASATRDLPGAGRIATTPGGDEGGNGSLPEFERLAEATRGAITMSAEARSSMAWRHDDTTETAWVLLVSSNYFSMVQAPVIAGRLHVAAVPGGAPSVAIGERFWRQKLQSRSLAGLTLRLNNADVTVSAVIPESFHGPAGIYSPDVWLPLEELTLFGTSARLQARDARWLFMMGQLAPGVSAGEAQGRLDAASEAMAREWPETHRARGAKFRPFSEGNSELRMVGAVGSVVMGIIGLVLLLACFNVTNMLLARAVERERDMGIRAALGAGPWRLVRMVVTEGFVLASLSGALALLVAWWTQSLVGAFAIPIAQPQHVDLTPDANVIGFIAALVAIAGVLPWRLARDRGRQDRRDARARIAGRQFRGRAALAAAPMARRRADRGLDRISGRGGAVRPVGTRASRPRSSASSGNGSWSPTSSPRCTGTRRRQASATSTPSRRAFARCPGSSTSPCRTACRSPSASHERRPSGRRAGRAPGRRVRRSSPTLSAPRISGPWASRCAKVGNSTARPPETWW